VRAAAPHAIASAEKRAASKKAALSFYGVRQLCCRFSYHAASPSGLKQILPFELSAVGCELSAAIFLPERCVGPRLPLLMRDPLPAPGNRFFCNGTASLKPIANVVCSLRFQK
jgi:hypothetical protein